MMSTAVLVSAVRICAAVKVGFADSTNAATAAAAGAAADPPKKGLPKPPTPVTETPSAAVISGLFNTVPPLDEKLPGVIAVESPLKKIWRGPSELKNSTWLLALNALGYGPLGVGAPADEHAGGVEDVGVDFLLRRRACGFFLLQGANLVRRRYAHPIDELTLTGL